MNRGGGLATLTVYPCDGAAMALAAAPRGSAQGLFSAPKYYPEDTCNYQTRTQICAAREINAVWVDAA